MHDKHVGIIGYGAIGRSIVADWSRSPLPGYRLGAILVRPHQADEARAAVAGGVVVTADFAEFLDRCPHAVVEAAGHTAVIAYGERILRKGTDFLLLSVGGLAAEGVLERLRRAAESGGSRVILPVGAIAGLDGLLALRRAGLHRVKYTSIKPPKSWLGTPAEQHFDLRGLTGPAVIFRGSAGEAARLFPKNANLAAAVGLAGLGFERTLVELVADPGARWNIGRIEAEGEGSNLAVTVAGSSSASNPKTSEITGMSVLSMLENAAAPVSFG
ncbi:MAG: Aspartate dehydrogenase [Ramlibacter sp.]|nr:Aspartate dehydrogenase [Ramlibacter sp.]